MVQINVENKIEPSTSKSVSFRNATEPATEEEMQIIAQVKVTLGQEFNEDLILKQIRFYQGDNKELSDLLNQVINKLIDGALESNAKESQTSGSPEIIDMSNFKPQEKATTFISPYRGEDGIVRPPPRLRNPDKEESDLQMALQESLQLSQGQTSYQLSLPENLQLMIREPNVSTGLYNTGNTCWFNCVAQVLFHIPQFRVLVYNATPIEWSTASEDPSDLTPETTKKRDFVVWMRRFFAEMEFTSCKYIEATMVLKVVDLLTRCKNEAESVLGSQQDATESLIRIMDWFDEGLKEAFNYRIQSKPEVIEDYIPMDSRRAAPASEMMDTLPPAYEETAPPLTARSNELTGTNNEQSGSPLATATASIIIGSEIKTDDGVQQVSPSFAAPMPPNDTSAVAMKQRRVLVSPLQAPTPMEVIECDSEEQSQVNTMREQMNELFHAVSYTLTYDDNGVQDSSKIDECSPLMFQLQVSYHNLHDALEAATFDTSRRRGNVHTFFEKLPAVLFMGLNRFSYKNNTSEKLHDRFIFPKEFYMDRYMKKNQQLIQRLQMEKMQLRNELAMTRAKLKGCNEFPHAAGTTKLSEAFRTTLRILEKEIIIDKEESTNFVGPLILPSFSRDDPFVPSLGREFPSLDESRYPTSELKSTIDLLRNIKQELETNEKELLEREQELTSRIESLYSIPELEEQKYQLHALIIHSGEASRGHYWAYVKDAKDQGDSWECLNDKNIDRVGWSQVEKDSYGNGSPASPSAYCLVYIKSNATWLLDHDDLSAEEAFEKIPDDLREMIEDKRERFRQDLERQSERRSRTRSSTIEEELQLMESRSDENANPTTSGVREELTDQNDMHIPLDRLSGYFLNENDRRTLAHVSDALEETMNSALMRPANIDDIAQQHTMDLSIVAEIMCSELLGYDAKLLDQTAVNDVENIYGTFLGEYFEKRKLSANEMCNNDFSNVLNFVSFTNCSLNARVYRFMLIYALKSTNMPALKEKAEIEFLQFEQSPYFAETRFVFKWVLLIYQLYLTIWTVFREASVLNKNLLIAISPSEIVDVCVDLLRLTQLGRFLYEKLLFELQRSKSTNSLFETEMELLLHFTKTGLLKLVRELVSVLMNSNVNFDTLSDKHKHRTIVDSVTIAIRSLNWWMHLGSKSIIKDNGVILTFIMNIFEMIIDCNAITTSKFKKEVHKSITNALKSNDVVRADPILEFPLSQVRSYVEERREVDKNMYECKTSEGEDDIYQRMIEQINDTVLQNLGG